MSLNDPVYPSDLESVENFSQAIEEQFCLLPNTEKGEKFYKLGTGLAFSIDTFVSKFSDPLKNQKSHDGGIDFVSEMPGTNVKLYGQSKLSIQTKDHLAEIFDDFYRIEGISGGPRDSVKGMPLPYDKPENHYVIITASHIDNLLKKYEGAGFPSFDHFYKQVKADGRIHIIQRHNLFEMSKNLYRRQFLPPREIFLSSPSGFIRHQNVFHGVIPASNLRKLYEEYGESLFFENIRDFLGIPKFSKDERTSVNVDIWETLEDQPEKMLERNNGVTFRGEKVIPQGTQNDGRHLLKIVNGGIVNGCQTTTCAAVIPLLSDKAFVSVKIVETTDPSESWDVARSTNTQNSISKIDLDLAEYLRPQFIKKLAAKHGICIEDEGNRFTSIVGSIYQTKASVSLIKHLAIGLFSNNSPQGMFQPAYDLIDVKTLRQFSSEQERCELLYGALFKLGSRISEARESAEARMQEKDRKLFHRFFNQDKAYCCYIGLIACMASYPEGIMDNYNNRMEWLDGFLSHINSFLNIQDGTLKSFSDIYYRTMVNLAKMIFIKEEDGSEDEIAQKMSSNIRSSKVMPADRLIRMVKMDLA